MKEKQREQVSLTLIVNHIMSNPLAGESARARLKQVALMTVIYVSVPDKGLSASAIWPRYRPHPWRNT
ncbi:hypothetical protein [Agrobacterium tumefaciens]|uniref:hypothetical protein n=1 Tax=Rhizobium/Agrobacterium group TaxID=227290 RepID=UPI0015740610|nr:hypothetical protein [Agrobacterium tumefaciens]NTA83919.1 hypothetical protein [Agrobacterium tumefaciens]